MPHLIRAAPGDLDATFGFGGKVLWDSPNNLNYYGKAVAVQPDGKILVAGTENNIGYGGGSRIIRFNPNGTLDSTFGTNGIITFPGIANGIAIQPDGKIVVAGTTVNQGGAFFIYPHIARYNPNGSLHADTNHIDWWQLLDIEAYTACRYGFLKAVVIQPDGKIVAGGDVTGVNPETCISNYSPSLSTLDYDMLVVRLTADFMPDSTFSGDGIVKASPFFSSRAHVNAMSLNQSNGKIALGGYTGFNDQTTNNFGIVIIDPYGSIDYSFNFGFYGTDFSARDDRVYGLAFEPDGKIVAGGTATVNAYFFGAIQRFALARFNTDGSLDTTFGTSGKVINGFSQTGDASYGLARQADGKIVQAGRAYFNSDFALKRYNLNGTLDSTFSVDGNQTTDFFNNSADVGRAVAIQADGKIVVAGDMSNGASTDVALARYLP